MSGGRPRRERLVALPFALVLFSTCDGAGRGATYSDPARGNHIPGEPVVRKLLCNIRWPRINRASRRSFAAPGTAAVDGLAAGLLTHNPNFDAPWRIDRSQAKSLIGICENNHDYTPEQEEWLAQSICTVARPEWLGLHPQLRDGVG